MRTTLTGETISIGFTVRDLADDPVTGLTFADFSYTIYKNQVVQAAALIFSEIGAGRYFVTLTIPADGLGLWEVKWVWENNEWEETIEAVVQDAVRSRSYVNLSTSTPTKATFFLAADSGATIYLKSVYIKDTLASVSLDDNVGAPLAYPIVLVPVPGKDGFFQTPEIVPDTTGELFLVVGPDNNEDIVFDGKAYGSVIPGPNPPPPIGFDVCRVFWYAVGPPGAEEGRVMTVNRRAGHAGDIFWGEQTYIVYTDAVGLGFIDLPRTAAVRFRSEELGVYLTTYIPNQEVVNLEDLV